MGERKQTTYRGLIAAALALAVMILPALSCSMFSGLGADVPGTRTAEAMIVEQRLKQTLAVEINRRTAQAATVIAQRATGTAEAQAQATQRAEEEATAAVEATQQAEAQATEAIIAQATQQAAGIYADVQQLVDKKALKTDQGTYYYLGDFEESVAKINYLTWWRTQYKPTSFVVKADITYESASMAANLDGTGCGFVFWDNGKENHYRVLMALDGNVYAEAYVNNKWNSLGKGFYGDMEIPKGSYNMELVVTDKNSWVYINGDMVKKVDVIARSKKEGTLSYTLASGTNKDYGTRCTFKNVELWVVQ